MPAYEPMGIFHLLALLVICGVLLYCLNAFVPMDAKFKRAVNVVVGVVLFLVLAWWLLGFFGVDPGAHTPRHW